MTLRKQRPAQQTASADQPCTDDNNSHGHNNNQRVSYTMTEGLSSCTRGTRRPSSRLWGQLRNGVCRICVSMCVIELGTRPLRVGSLHWHEHTRQRSAISGCQWHPASITKLMDISEDIETGRSRTLKDILAPSRELNQWSIGQLLLPSTSGDQHVARHVRPFSGPACSLARR
jgi:hypothetical protein